MSTDAEKLQAMLTSGLPIIEVIGGSFTPERSLTSEEMLIASDIMNPPNADELDFRGARRALIDGYRDAVARLEQIENANPATITQAQVVAAIKDMAKYQKQLIKVLRKLLF